MKSKTKTEVLETVANEAALVQMSYLNRDLMVSVLIVSLVVNLFVLTAWVTLQVTSIYDSQIAAFLFVR